MTGVTKAVVYAILCGMVHLKEPLLLIGKSSPFDCGSFLVHGLVAGSMHPPPPQTKQQTKTNKLGGYFIVAIIVKVLVRPTK